MTSNVHFQIQHGRTVFLMEMKERKGKKVLNRMMNSCPGHFLSFLHVRNLKPFFMFCPHVCSFLGKRPNTEVVARETPFANLILI